LEDIFEELKEDEDNFEEYYDDADDEKGENYNDDKYIT